MNARLGLPMPYGWYVVAYTDDKVVEGSVNAASVADIRKQITEDIPIWENKTYREQPTLCDGDGPIARFRKWYSQFYA